MSITRSALTSMTVFCLLTVQTSFAGDPPSAPKKETAEKEPDRAVLEKAFSEKLSGSALVGVFSIVGKNDDKPPRPERYELESVTKLRDDYWVFLARIQYGQKDVKLPITLKVLWAGDTPVITLTDLNIPALGTFTARVMFHGDRYVGTWQHNQVGGHMWGVIEKAKAEQEETSEVQGKVILNGKPLQDATIRFEPADGKGQIVQGKTNENGQFEVALPVGQFRVKVQNEQNAIPAKYDSATALVVQVRPGENTFDFELAN